MTTTVELTSPGATCLDTKLHDVTDGSGVNVHGAARGCEIGRCDIDGTLDSNILLTTHTVGGHHVHDCVLRGAGSFGGSGSPNHGIYDSAQATLVERADSGHHSNGHCFSPRWPNAYYQCASHDNPSGHGVFDYSDGSGGMLLIREELAHDLTDWWCYFGPYRRQPGTDKQLGPLSFALCADHCTLDLRGCTDHGLNLQECLQRCYLTNSVVIADGPWFFAPAGSSNLLDLTGTKVLSSAQAAQWLNVDYTPKKIPGNPLIGSAKPSPPPIASHWPEKLLDIGRFQTTVRDLKSISLSSDGTNYSIYGAKTDAIKAIDPHAPPVTWHGKSRQNALIELDVLAQRIQ